MSIVLPCTKFCQNVNLDDTRSLLQESLAQSPTACNEFWLRPVIGMIGVLLPLLFLEGEVPHVLPSVCTARHNALHVTVLSGTFIVTIPLLPLLQRDSMQSKVK